MAEELTQRVLDVLAGHDGELLSNEAFPESPFNSVKSALDRLGSREMVNYQQIDREEAALNEESERIAANGSHEARVFEAVRAAVDGLKLADLPVCWLDSMPARLELTSGFGTKRVVGSSW